MAKNDFDIDFDFEKEYGFDPKAVLDSEYTDEDLDLSQFDEEALGIDLEQESESEFEDFDLDSLDLGEDAAEQDVSAPQDREEAFALPEEPELDLDDMDLEDVDFEEGEQEPEDADLAFTRRANFFGVDTGALPTQPQYEEPAYEESGYEGSAYETHGYEEPAQEPPYEEAELEQEEEPGEEAAGSESHRRRERTRKERTSVKLTVPPILTNLIRLYIPNQQEINARMEAGDGRRRRRPSKQQIFKEYYLPPVILGLSLVLILSFVIGALSNVIDSAKLKREEEEKKALQESLAAEQLASEGESLMAQAELLAKEYDYDGAIQMLDSYGGEMSQEMTAKRAEYVNAKSSLVEYQDPTLIPNLSFHVLIADMGRAIADQENGGQYNRNFVSTAEFEKILNQLYLNNYVLVDFDSFVAASSMDGTSEIYNEMSIWLPEGKKPVMITETLVNYLSYMIDGNKDGIPDSGGAGFASRLVVDDNGDIKAEYVDANNVTQVGNYDLVPILEDFIAEHPDFCYRGARATLAVCGYEGIFGYRIQSETIANKGQDYYNEQVVGATKVVDALREKGYRLACYSFDNKDYSKISADMVNQDIQKWKSQIAPVIGEVDTIVFARGTDIGDYTGGKFDVLHAAGFRYLIKSGETPYTEINNTYVRQTRLMVTGENMVGKSSMFTSNNLFDPNTVLDLATRGNVPVG
ncbi:MAG: hypothetical protein ACI3V0_07940 [Faecousia sp.]